MPDAPGKWNFILATIQAPYCRAMATSPITTPARTSCHRGREGGMTGGGGGLVSMLKGKRLKAKACRLKEIFARELEWEFYRRPRREQRGKARLKRKTR